MKTGSPPSTSPQVRYALIFYQLTDAVSSGVYYYKYVVDGQWIHDPKQEWEEDGKGNINNVMRVEDRVTMKLKEISQKLEEMRSFLDEPWQVHNNNNNFCVKM